MKLIWREFVFLYDKQTYIDFIDSVPQAALCVFDSQIYMNKKCLSLLALQNQENFKVEDFFKSFQSQHKSDFLNLYENNKLNSVDTKFIMEFKKTDSSLKKLEISISFNQNNEIWILNPIIDIKENTSIKPNERNLNSANTLAQSTIKIGDHLQDIFNTMSEGVIGLDAHAHVFLCNHSAKQILGFTENELKHSNFLNLTHHSNQEGTPYNLQTSPMLQPLQNQKSIKIQNEILWRDDGTCFPIDYNSSVLKENDNIIGVLVSFMDMTEAHNASSTIKAQRNKLFSAARINLLGEMAAGLAHEINNPLSIIHGKASQLKYQIESGEIDFDQFKLEMDKIESSSKRIAKIIKGLKSFSRSAESDPIQKNKLSNILDDVTEMLRERFKSYSIKLTIEKPEEIVFECRASQIIQILMNLIGNSADAIEKLNDKWIKIECTIENKLIQNASEEFLKIRVTDSGSGVPDEIANQMMTAFFTTKHHTKSAGLGLSVSKSIAEEYQGSLVYDPSSAHTSFVLEIPIKQKKIEFVKKVA